MPIRPRLSRPSPLQVAHPRRHGPLAAALRPLGAGGLLAAVLSAAAGCDTVERLPDTPPAERVERVTRADVPRIMRGTVGSEVSVDGFAPVLLRGYGLVVGLDGTGCTTMPPELLQHMTQELVRRGVGSERAGMGDLSPERMLRAPDTAVVIVEGLLPPGAAARQASAMGGRPGTAFDVRVFLDPRTDASSLDGGRLFTCELRPVSPGQSLPPTGSQQARPLAVARGPVFVNPFADPSTPVGAAVDRTRGRILEGGEAIADNPLKLRLLTPSHARAEILTSAINTRFPREPGMANPTATGESDESIQVTVPISWRDDPEGFVETLRHMTIRQANPESVAASIRRIVQQDPGYAGTAMARWHALGRKALPVIRDLYDAANRPVRTAALEAGARLGDALVVPPLLAMLEDDSSAVRRDAVRLMGEPIDDPRIEFALLEALDDADLEVRLAAYEGLHARDSLLLDRAIVGRDEFILDVVESDHPLIYVAQIGRPRIVVFGRDLELSDAMPVDVWSGRMIIKEMSDEADRLEIFYRPSPAAPAELYESPRRVRDLIVRLGRDRSFESPDPGLGLTYAEVLGALYELRREGTLAADFKAEQDRVQAAIARALAEAPERGMRPDFAEPSEAPTGPAFIDVPAGGSGDPGGEAAPPPAGRGDGDPRPTRRGDFDAPALDAAEG